MPMRKLTDLMMHPVSQLVLMLGAVVLIGGLFATAPPMPTIATAPIAGGMAIPTALPPTTPTPWPTPSPTLADLPIELIAEVPPALPTVSATLLPTATPTAGVWYAGGTLYTVTIAHCRTAQSIGDICRLGDRRAGTGDAGRDRNIRTADPGLRRRHD